MNLPCLMRMVCILWNAIHQKKMHNLDTKNGAKKQKLIANIQKEISKVTAKLEKLRIVYNDAVLLHDQYGSDKGVMESVNTGRTLLDRMSKFEIQFTAYLGKLKDLNAKLVSKREWDASLKLLLDTNAPF